MGDFATDTEVGGGDGEYRAQLSGQWEIWGPMGGYVAAVEVRRATRPTAAIAVRMTQDYRPILDAQCWFAAGSELVRHDHALHHGRDDLDATPPFEEVASEAPTFPFWRNFEVRPLDWVDDWDSYPRGRAHVGGVAAPDRRSSVVPRRHPGPSGEHDRMDLTQPRPRRAVPPHRGRANSSSDPRPNRIDRAVKCVGSLAG